MSVRDDIWLLLPSAAEDDVFGPELLPPLVTDEPRAFAAARLGRGARPSHQCSSRDLITAAAAMDAARRKGDRRFAGAYLHAVLGTPGSSHA